MSSSEGFAHRRVLGFESRRAAELRTMIAARHGVPYVVPALELRPRAAGAEITAFTEALVHGDLTAVVLLTGVGTQLLAAAVEQVLPKPELASHLNRLITIARGPKSLAALRALGVSAAVPVPPPHTSRQILDVIDVTIPSFRDCRIAVQEYGEPAHELLDGLRERGAVPLTVSVYDWSLPSDIQPLRDAMTAVVNGDVNVLLFTAAVQADHLFRIGAAGGVADQLRGALASCCIASIGPMTTGALRRHGVIADLEPARSSMGILVAEAAARAAAILERKRA